MRYRNQEVWIAYDGVAAPEFGPVIPSPGNPSTNTATAYLMSEKDKVFTVNWRHIAPNTLTSVAIRMDGVLVHQIVSLPGAIGGQLRGLVSGSKSFRPFVFSNIPRLEDPDPQLAIADDRGCRDFGTIQVVIAPIHYVQSIPTLPVTDGPLCGNVSPSPRSDIHRVSLHKQLSVHSEVSGGDSPTIPIMPPFDMQLMNEAAAIFEFRYGPLVCLQNIGVVPPRFKLEGPIDASPSTPIPSTLGKRPRSQYEDILSLGEKAETATGAAPAKIIRTYSTRLRVKEESGEELTEECVGPR